MPIHDWTRVPAGLFHHFHVAVNDRLPDMPLFLTNYVHVLVPLEPTYQATWDASPEEMRLAVETGVMPEPDAG